jgi:release factor glutamine methyltransferase
MIKIKNIETFPAPVGGRSEGGRRVAQAGCPHPNPPPTGEGKKLKDIYRDLATVFREAELVTPELDARVLLAKLTDQTSAQIPISGDGLNKAQVAKLDQWRARRLKHESVARITGKRGFWTLDLEVSVATLEPRPDSETLVEAALERLGNRRNEKLKILDLGTGTGALLLAFLSECKNAFGIGVDISSGAVQTAKRNAGANQLAARAQFVCGNWFDAFGAKFDLIVANPPYIPTAALQELGPEVRLYDPIWALDGGPDGLQSYRAIAAQARSFLNQDGIILLEVGYDQSEAVALLFGACGYRHLTTKCDLSGHRRALIFAPIIGQKTDRQPDKKRLEKRPEAAKTIAAPATIMKRERAQNASLPDRKFLPQDQEAGSH